MTILVQVGRFAVDPLQAIALHDVGSAFGMAPKGTRKGPKENTPSSLRHGSLRKYRDVLSYD